ncbi:hypothetical protein PO124_07050 [Bacillus licheniformis]|nr:hypothetical protein [Bacillus licheniformis]
MYEFHKKDYTNAINYYKLAEEKLRTIPDQIEIAEFHYKLAIAYYQIKQNFLSLNHAKTALKPSKHMVITFKSDQQRYADRGK